MYHVVHKVGRVDGNVITYWHHVMQLMVMVSDSVFTAQRTFGSTNGEIVLLSDDPKRLSFYVEKYGWIPQLNIPIRYENESLVDQLHPTIFTTRRCDPLKGSGQHETDYCYKVHQEIRTLVTRNLRLTITHANSSILVVREPTRTRRISNLGEMITVSGMYALLHKHSFHSIMLEDMPLREQLQWFYSARHIVVARGSATANLLICRPTTRVVLASSPDKWTPTYWIPAQYTVSFATVHGGNFVKEVTLDVTSLRKALVSTLP